MVYAPQPINQFNRLIHSSGPQVTGTYILGARWNNIHNGQNWDGRNCTAAIGAVAIDAQTGGRTKSNPVQIRNNQSDWSGGIGFDDVNEAWAKLWPGNQIALPYSVDWADVIAYLKAGRFVPIQGDYDQVPYTYQCQKGGTFDHAFGLGGFRTSDSKVLYYDPLCRRAIWVPQSVIRPAAEKFALAQRGTRTRLFAGYTRVMPAPPTTLVSWRVRLSAQDFWDYDVNGNIITGRTRRTTGGFQAACSAPKPYYWPGIGTRTLVRILAPSSHAGKHIHATFAYQV